jgi:Uncharacterized conserved protein
MALNRICEGKVLTYTNTSGVDILSGAPVLIGATLGVAITDIPNTLSGSVVIEDVYEIRKASGAIAQGAKLYWDADGNPQGSATGNGLSGTGCITTTENGNVYAGRAYHAAGATDATVQIKLNA